MKNYLLITLLLNLIFPSAFAQSSHNLKFDSLYGLELLGPTLTQSHNILVGNDPDEKIKQKLSQFRNRIQLQKLAQDNTIKTMPNSYYAKFIHWLNWDFHTIPNIDSAGVPTWRESVPLKINESNNYIWYNDLMESIDPPIKSKISQCANNLSGQKGIKAYSKLFSCFHKVLDQYNYPKNKSFSYKSSQKIVANFLWKIGKELTEDEVNIHVFTGGMGFKAEALWDNNNLPLDQTVAPQNKSIWATRDFIESWWMDEDLMYGFLCHELGHHYGEHKKRIELRNASYSLYMSNEGEADFYAAKKCLKKMFDGKLFIISNTEDQNIFSLCKNVFKAAQDQNICAKVATTGMKMAYYIRNLGEDMLKDSLSFNQVIHPINPILGRKKNEKHPTALCTLAIYTYGALCDSKNPNNNYCKMPDCWAQNNF